MKNQTFGEMITRMRKENGMTQLELADRMGVTDKAVSKWERDLSLPDTASLPRLAEIFGISVDELMQGKAEAKADAGKDPKELFPLVTRAVALAMGVSAAVLGILGSVDLNSACTMLGVGLACVALNMFSDSKK